MLNWPLREKIERNLNANAFWAAHGYWWTNVARHIWSTKWALTWQEVCINSICILNMNYGNWLFTSIYTFYLRIFKFGTCNYGEIGETRSFFRQKRAVIEYLLKQFAEYKKYTQRERERHTLPDAIAMSCAFVPSALHCLAFVSPLHLFYTHSH